MVHSVGNRSLTFVGYMDFLWKARWKTYMNGWDAENVRGTTSLSVTNATDVLIPPTALRASKDLGAEYA